MGNQVTDYTFTIIEDGQVPLAGNFDTINYTPVVLAVVLCLALIALVGYTVWFLSHLYRVSVVMGSQKEAFIKYYFHPVKLIRELRELEYEMVSMPAIN